MIRPAIACLTFFVALGLTLPAVRAADDDEKDRPTREVEVEDITLNVPEDWKQTPVTSQLRKAQFEIPPAEGDREPTELVVFFFGGASGTLQQNLARWRGEFDRQGLREKLTTGTSPQGDYVVADLRGTHVGSSFMRRPQPLRNARMLMLVLDVEGKGAYYLKMTGPEKTVESAALDLRRAVGADPEKEQQRRDDTE